MENDFNKLNMYFDICAELLYGLQTFFSVFLQIISYPKNASHPFLSAMGILTDNITRDRPYLRWPLTLEASSEPLYECLYSVTLCIALPIL